jgi:Tfp pilus assembly protein PilZ
VEPVQLAKMARESLAVALNAIQSCDDAPDELFDAAEPIAQTITILRKIERGGGAMLDGRDVALKNVRKILADVQNIEGGHPAADEVLEAVAASLAKVNALARWKVAGQPSVPPPAEAPAPKAAPPPVSAPKPAPAPVSAPKPVPAPVSAPKPVPAPAAPRPVAPPMAQHFDEPRHVLDSRPTPAPQPVVQAKPVVAQPAPAPAPQPVVQAKPVVVAQPEPAPAPQPVVQAKPVVVAQPEPAPAPQPVVQAKPVVVAQPEPAPAPPPVVQAKPVVVAQPEPAPAVAAPAPEPKAVPKKVEAPPAPPGVRTLVVSLGTRSVSNFYRGLGGNDVIEHGGVFVETYRIPKIGTQVQLHVHMPGDYEFYALATVMWSRETGGSSEPGFGARFTQIGNDGRQLVYRYSRIREPMFYDDL